MPYPGLRKFTITLTIVVIVVHLSCGFTLHRKETEKVIPATSTDLAALESLQVQSIKRPHDITQGKDEDTDKAIKSKHKFINEQKVNFIETTNDSKGTEKIIDTVEDKITTLALPIEEYEVTDTSVVAETTTEGMETTSENNTILRSLKRESAVNSTEHDNVTKNYSVEITTVKIQPESDEPITEMEVKEAQESTIKLKNVEEVNEDKVSNTMVVPTANDQFAIDTEANISPSKEPISRKTTIDITETESIETKTEPSSTSSTLSSSSEIPMSTYTSEVTTDFKSSTDKLNLKSLELPEVTVKSSSTIVEVKVTKDSSTTTEPTWKKYVTIERKRTGSSEESTSTEKDLDLAKTELIHTTIRIPLLEMLEEGSYKNHQTTVEESQAETATLYTESSSTSESVESTQPHYPGTLASKRAGFLDLSKRISDDYQETTDQNISDRKMTESETTNIDSSKIKMNLSGFKSQGEMAEDAMREEELLKEETLNNHDENAKRYEGSKDFSDNAKPDLAQSQAIEDNLSVQPISQDRRTTLYTVGPNYKPMKRIEVQPAKPFVRDPDDNSWRNESISSLGIVFKPKNSSSKSFKEVLKTKTETEFNNVQDKDSKEDTPELRERLEKIAEVRKSKKKKVDKFGEVVYTDYEEGSSAEGINTPKVEIISAKPNTPAFTSTDIPETEEVTSPLSTTESERYWKNKLESISKEEMFKDLGIDILTTQKTKKPYNLAEYYDTTDEYDADYVTLPKIDLKKFTIPFKPSFPSLTSPPVTPPTTVVMPSKFPDRKPTVQYFPPTTKPPKVNVNDYDANFERRVQQYTLQENQKTNLPFTASDPVATERPQMRSSVKPSDFSMFTPQSPDRMTKYMFATGEPRMTDAFVVNDGNYNRGTYVIKHYKDFLKDAAKEEEDVRSPEFVSFTEPPARGVTLDESPRKTKDQRQPIDFDYDSQFRKDVLSRFVANFNQNSDRFKVDFPVLFNTSVVHRSNDEQGKVLASSSTFMRRLYGSELSATQPAPGRCGPGCDNATLELSPAYELHYYVPEQEEQGEAELAATLPYSYKL